MARVSLLVLAAAFPTLAAQASALGDDEPAGTDPNDQLALQQGVSAGHLSLLALAQKG